MLYPSLRNFKVHTLRALVMGSVAAAMSCGTGDGKSSSAGNGSSSTAAASSSTSQSSSVAVAGLPLIVQSDNFARFKDSTPAQLGDCTSDSAVDMAPSLMGQGCDVGWTEDGEWLEYDINMPASGSFDLALSVGSGISEGAIRVLINDQLAGKIEVPNIGWSAFQERVISQANFSAGFNTLRVEFLGAVNLDYLRIGDLVQMGPSDKPQGIVFAMRAGYSPLDNGAGLVYQPDMPYASAGSVRAALAPVLGTDEPQLYHYERFGDFTYELPIANGTYNITLKMVEMYWGEAGQRVFDITAEGRPVISDLDLFYMVGQNHAFDVTASNINVMDGGLTINFNASANFATVSAVVIERLGGGVSSSSSSSSAVAVSSSSVLSSSSAMSSSSVVSSSSSVNSSSSLVSSSSESSASSSSSAPVSSSSEMSSSSSSAAISSSSEVSSSSSSAPADSDNDGVVDDHDNCPNTTAGATVDANGCEGDADGDGVLNSADQCANTTAGASVDTNGCELDTDGDGVVDSVDQCPATLAGESVDNQGCASSQKDSDGDGVNDNLDQCPATATNASVDAQGCAAEQKDSDGDGIFDHLDQCPATPTGESADNQGCSTSQIDSDQDGVNDALDQCPGTPSGATVDGQGCGPSQTDGDSDGVNNAADLCPATPAGESVDSDGCSSSQKDADADGITDNLDQCAGTPATESADGSGCSPSQKDSDSDGVNDAQDQCPATPAGAAVNAQGCGPTQTDGDNDGVNNAVDLCPATPTGEAVDSNGCSASQTDADNDGVKDNADICASTPAGEAVDGTGCSSSQKDLDNDGVKDNVDACPSTPAGQAVDGTGCSSSQKDSDNDGVKDNVDACPSTPAGQAVDGTGCSSSQKDSDNDGVNDNVDACPSTPVGQAADANGCSSSQKDSDNDGVKDNVDACPSTPAGQAVDGTGCSSSQKDSDNDGITDNVDACPSTPAGQAADANGCSSSQKDSDNDGVTDNIDACPATPAGAKINASGCAANQLTGNVSQGQATWATSCAGCHGNYVNDGLVATMNIDPNSLKKTTNANLAAYIEGNMPQGNVTSCEGQCAANTAAFVRTLAAKPDADKDGVFDSTDTCPNTPASESADVKGCSFSQINATALYGSQCVTCHGVDGAGASAPPLYGLDAGFLQAAIANTAAGATMPIIGRNLTTSEVTALGILMTNFPAPALDGAALYADKGCAGCHSANGSGGAGPDIRGKTAANLTAILSSGPTMSAAFIAGNLNAKESQAIGDYLSTLQPDATNGATLYAAKVCSACHGPNRQGGSFPELSAATLNAKYNFTTLRAVVERMNSSNSVGLTGGQISDVTAFLLQ